MQKPILLLLGILYYFAIQIHVVDLRQTNPSLGLFSFVLKTPISQNVQLHIGTDKYKLISLVCAKEKISFNNQKRLWFESNAGEESTTFYIPRGEELCYARVRNKGKKYTPIIKQKISFIDYGILFLLIGYPLISFVFTLFVSLLNKIKSKIDNSIFFSSIPMKNLSKRYSIGIFIILLLAIVLRILYFQKYGVYQFQHDWQGHVEFIKYMATHWDFPLPSKGLQFPQQPLYYILSATILDVHTFQLIGYFSLLCSIIFLYYGYKFFTRITDNTWVIIIATLFISFTPSLIYMAARINNDVLVMALSAFSLYYIVKSYQHHFTKHFYPALIGTSMLFMTKISAAPIELLLFTLLVMTYLYQEHTMKLQKQLFIFSFVGLFLLGFTLLRVYMPIENTFHFVNSSGSFRNQHIPSLDFSFFTYFNLTHLFNTEYITSFTKETSLYTFINHQYRTMLIGEFDYSSYLNKMSEFKPIIWLLFSFGLIYILGFFSYLHYLWKSKGIHRVVFVTLILNFILILKFVVTYPAICNTDFRYFVPSFLIIAYVFAQGLVHISIYRWIGYLVGTIILLLTMSEIWFFNLLIF